MAPRVNDELRFRIVHWHVHFGLKPLQIADLAGCKLRTVQYILAWFRDFNSVCNPFAHHQCGRKRSRSTADIDFLTSILDARPKTFLDEMQEELYERRGVDVSLGTLSRTLRRVAVSKKKVVAAAAERNELLRAIWQAEYAHLPAEYFIWLDESSVDDLTNLRRSGCSAMGQACVSRDTFIRGQRYSVLPALTVHGIVALDIFEGSVNKERFISFIQNDVAPLLNPFPGPCSAVVLDNCAIHHDEAIRQIVEVECGAKLIYLPPYSPDFNPIEQAFHSIKSWLRRREAQAVNAAIRPWLIHQGKLSITPDMAIGWARNSGYSLEEDL